MRIAIVGAGAVGGYFGGRLAEAGLDVTFLVREKRAAQLKNTGLVIKSSLGDFELKEPKIATDAKDIPACDLVILAVKNYHLEGSMEALRQLVAKGAKVLPLLNGVEHFERLTQEFGEQSILGGVCHVMVTLDSQGQILHSGPLQNIIFGPLQVDQTDFCRNFIEKAAKAKMKLSLSEDILSDIWNKYVFITAFSGVTAASRLPIDRVLAYEPTKEVYRQALSEVFTLALAKGANLPETFIEDTIRRMGKMPEGSTSSLHQDLRKGLRLEVESLQGAAVRLGEKMGIELSTIKTLYGLIKPYEEGQRE